MKLFVTLPLRAFCVLMVVLCLYQATYLALLPERYEGYIVGSGAAVALAIYVWLAIDIVRPYLHSRTDISIMRIVSTLIASLVSVIIFTRLVIPDLTERQVAIKEHFAATIRFTREQEIVIGAIGLVLFLLILILVCTVIFGNSAE